MAFAKFQENRFKIDGKVAEDHAITFNLTASISRPSGKRLQSWINVGPRLRRWPNIRPALGYDSCFWISACSVYY